MKRNVIPEQYPYKSFQPVAVNRQWRWENPDINNLNTLPLSVRLLKDTHATLLHGVRSEHEEFHSVEEVLG